jgi:hypothetical protein
MQTGGPFTVRGVNNCGNGAVSANYTEITLLSIGRSTSSNQTICSGSAPANITSSRNWFCSMARLIQYFLNNIAGATASTLTAAQMGSLTVTTYYRAIVTSGACSSAISTTVTIKVISGGEAFSDQIICHENIPDDITIRSN